MCATRAWPGSFAWWAVARAADDRAMAVAFVLALAGGVGALADWLVGVPPVVAAAYALSFVAGVVLAGVLGFRAARREGDGVGRALWRGLRTFWSWLWAFLP